MKTNTFTDLYIKSKQYINSVYGMQLDKNIIYCDTDSVTYELNNNKQKEDKRMTINNKYTTEIALVEMKILIFESEYKKAKNENFIIRNYFETLIFTNKLYINNLIYNSYELEINNIYNLIETLQDENVKHVNECNIINCHMRSNNYNYNLCEKLIEDMNENNEKIDHNDDKIDEYKKIINKLRNEREEELTKWKQ